MRTSLPTTVRNFFNSHLKWRGFQLLLYAMLV